MYEVRQRLLLINVPKIAISDQRAQVRQYAG